MADFPTHTWSLLVPTNGSDEHVYVLYPDGWWTSVEGGLIRDTEYVRQMFDEGRCVLAPSAEK